MRRLVRDDIIALDSFVAAEFKYKEYLELLMKSGNYCFLDQFKNLIPSGSSIVRGMIDNNLVGTENLNNSYKYIYLSDTAIKYLYLRDSEDDYSGVTKNRINVKKITKNPTEKQLLSSAYKFHLLAKGEELIDKDSILEDIVDKIVGYTLLEKIVITKERIENLETKLEKLENQKKKFENYFEVIVRKDEYNLINTRVEQEKLSKLYQEKQKIRNDIEILKNSKKLMTKNKIEELEKQLANVQILINELEEKRDLKNIILRNYNNNIKKIEKDIERIENQIFNYKAKLDEAIETHNKMHDEARPVVRKIQTLYDISKIIVRIINNTVEFIILDTGSLKPAFSYLKKINELNQLSSKYKKVKIIIYSYSETRGNNLYNEFLKAKKYKQEALNIIKKYDFRTQSSLDEQKLYQQSEKIYNSTPEFEVEVSCKFYYMNAYKELTSSTTKSIKRKDRKAINDLIFSLNQRE